MKYCEPHLERAGVQVEAVCIIGNTPLCRACKSGKTIHDEESFGDPDPKCRKTAVSSGGRVLRMNQMVGANRNRIARREE